jgi:Domain of unknown function (DUF4388)
MESQQEKILGGNLETLGLQATLKMLALGGKTGQLLVNAVNENSADETPIYEHLTIYLLNGAIIGMQSSSPISIDLLEMFRLLRMLPPQEIASIRTVAGSNLPDVLNEMVLRNYMTPAEQAQRFEFAIIQEIARALKWERGTFEFQNTANSVHAFINLNVDHVLLEAIRLLDEWGKVTTPGLNRYSTPRWLPDVSVDIRTLPLTRDDVNVLFLSNGQVPIYAIAYALMQNEARIAAIVEQLLNYHMIEVIDSQLERQLEQNLSNALKVSQRVLKQDGLQSPEQRLQTLIQAMGTCVNKLLSHHSIFARALRGRDRSSDNGEELAYLEHVFTPIFQRVQQQFPIIETITFQKGQLDYQELLKLDKLVKGDQLEAFYWEGVQGFQVLSNETFHMIVADEVGQTRVYQRLNELWQIFSQEIAHELERQRVRRMAAQRRMPPGT